MGILKKKYTYSFSVGKINKSINELTDLTSKLNKHFGEMDISNTRNDETIRENINRLTGKLNNMIDHLNSYKNSVHREK